jgi:hypothetical protein
MLYGAGLLLAKCDGRSWYEDGRDVQWPDSDSVAEEVDAPIIGHFERVLLTRVSTLPNSQGAMTGFKRGFDGLMIVESARNRSQARSQTIRT